MIFVLRNLSKKQKANLLFGGFLAIILVIAMEFSFWNINFDDKEKNNLKEDDITNKDSLNIGGIDVSLVSSGDGLYADSYEDGRYIYRGSNPDNYIVFNETNGTEYRIIYQGFDIGITFDTKEVCEEYLISERATDFGSCLEMPKYTDGIWRIIAKESDGTYKIIKDNLSMHINSNGEEIDVDLPMIYDDATARITSNNTYCTNTNGYGCGVFGKVEGLFQTPSGNYSGTVTEDSSIAKYLNNEYYNSLSDILKQKLQTHQFNIGAVEMSQEDSIEKNIAGEKMYKWTGNVGLINISDILRASTNSKCASLSALLVSGADSYNESICSQDYLFYGYSYWTINSCADSEEDTSYCVLVPENYGLFDSGTITPYYASLESPLVRPVVYLKENIKLSGDGTMESPYIVQ